MADPKAIQFLEGIYARVDKQVRDIVTSMLPGVTIAAQENGSVVTNDHRILNFQGPGVVVSDEPHLRRTNVYIPGAPTGTASSTVVSAAGAGKFYDLGVGGTPPTNWYQPSYSDAAWTTPVADGYDYSAWATPTGSTWIAVSSATSFSNNQEWLYRRTFTLTSDTLTSATLEFNVDDYVTEAYINGTLFSSGASAGSPTATQTTSVPLSSLVLGGSNLLALRIKNHG